MLSTAYRLRLSGICAKIVRSQPVELTDRIWASKLGEVNRTAAAMLRQAHRSAANPNMAEGGLDAFLNALDIGGQPVRRFRDPEDIANWFRRDDTLDWRQRD
jgi:hypothetical protein